MLQRSRGGGSVECAEGRADEGKADIMKDSGKNQVWNKSVGPSYVGHEEIE